MAMIEVKHLQKNFVKTVKEPGLKGALRSFIHPEKQTFEAVKDLTFGAQGADFRFYRGKWCWEVNNHQNADRDFKADIWLLSD